MKYLAFLLLCLMLHSCELNPPPPKCIESEEFNVEESYSDAYQAKVLSLIETALPHDFRYFFKTFFEENNKTYMMLNFRNKWHCFDVKVLVNNWDKLGGMRKVNGKAYPKELVKLKWSIEEIDGKKEVVYKDMNTIID